MDSIDLDRQTGLTAEQRRLRAKAAALAQAAQGKTNTKAGTEAFLARFERQVDPEGILSPEERARRAGFARRSHMASLQLRSSLARAKARSA